ncbi:MAG TPA: DUF5947 family protein [Actinopolymorphaceae bacterium]
MRQDALGRGALGQGALDRMIRRSRRPDTVERCELCGADVAPSHGHVLDVDHDQVLCACRACALLFERDAAAEGRYRLVPDVRVRLAGYPLTELGIPVGLAFFVQQDAGGPVVAHYPSPVGATRWELPVRTWSDVLAGCPPLRSMRPRVEALLVNTVRGADEHWLVSIADCFRLVAAVRRDWKGMSGGRQVWETIDRFFADLGRGRSRPAEEGAP